MAIRYVLGALAGAALFGSAGCGVGPINDRLYVSEWRSNKDHPIKLARDWVYQGEQWEHHIWVDTIPPKPKEQ